MFTKIITDNSCGVENIYGVRLDLSSSTSRAEIFATALKMCTLDWTDPILRQVTKLVNARVLECAKAMKSNFYYVVTMKKGSGSTFELYPHCDNAKRAKELALISYPEYEIVKAEKKVRKEKYDFSERYQEQVVNNSF